MTSTDFANFDLRVHYLISLIQFHLQLFLISHAFYLFFLNLFARSVTNTVQLWRIFANAFMRWSEWTSLTFTECVNYFTTDIKIGFYAGDHGDGEEFDGVLVTLAHAFAPPRGLLHLDNEETWIVGDIFGSGSGTGTKMDLESVAVHEIRHLLGLGTCRFAAVDNLDHCTKYLNQTLGTFGFLASLDLFATREF
ncbi:putative envelysin [Helianthus anomalus]